MIHFTRSARALAVLMISMTISGPVWAQRAPLPDAQEYEPPLPPYQSSPAVPETRQGSVASSTVGEAGRRQTRDQEIGGIKPMVRINNRIANRIQSRLRTRIDRNYDPQANASPFEVAGEEVRTPGRSRNR